MIDAQVRGIQDLRAASVILFKMINLSFVFFWKLEDVSEVSSPPAVDRLCVITDDHQVLMRLCQFFENPCLDVVGVLIFIHQNILQLFFERQSFAVFQQEFQPVFQ